jgi:hypothetical protein
VEPPVIPVVRTDGVGRVRETHDGGTGVQRGEMPAFRPPILP